MSSCGLIRANINEPYAQLGAAIMRDKSNVVGIYYDDAVILYRTFDGSSVSYFPACINLEILSSHYLISDLTIYPLDIESWKVDCLSESCEDSKLSDRFKNAYSKSLLSYDSTRDYKKILLYYTGISTAHIVNGYFKVNEISLAACGEDPYKSSDIISQSIICTKYHKKPEPYSTALKHAYTTPSRDTIRRDTSSYIKELADAFTELMFNNVLFQKYISSLGNTIISSGVLGDISLFIERVRLGSISEKDRLTLVEILAKDINGINIDDLSSPKTIDSPKVELEGIREDITIIRSTIQSLLDGINGDKLPVIMLPSLIESYNRIADMTGSIRISPSSANSTVSTPALVVTGSQNMYSDDISVNLECGDVVLISSKYPDWTEFNYNELIEILRYLLSIRSFDTRFNHLITKLTEELSIRSRDKNTL